MTVFIDLRGQGPTPQELRQMIEEIPDEPCDHPRIIRALARQLLESELQNLLLAALIEDQAIERADERAAVS